MSENKKQNQEKAPKCPPQEELPPPEIIWEGYFTYLAGHHPCRIVLAWSWTLPHKAGAWIQTPKYVYDRAESKDVMGEWRYAEASLNDIPIAFFVDVVDAFRKCREG